jgi:hypothetical protein
MDMIGVRIDMRRFILNLISGHHYGLININNSDEPFKFLESE